MSSSNMPDRSIRPGEWQEYRHDTGETLDFRCIRSARRTIALYVHRDGTVLVRAPLRVPHAEVVGFVRERWDWLQRHLTRFSEEPAPLRQRYGEGERVLHLGEELTLRLANGGRSRVSAGEGVLLLTLPGGRDDGGTIERLVTGWQRREARRLFAERLLHCHAAMQALALPFPQLKIRAMRSRWGSCSRRAIITLNLELVRMPQSCIDYVITHELCHLVEFNHGPRFYALQERFMPDWQERRRRLEDIARSRPR